MTPNERFVLNQGGLEVQDGGGKWGEDVKYVANTRLNLPSRSTSAVDDVGRRIFKRKQTRGDTTWEIEFCFVCFVCKMRLCGKQRHYPGIMVR